MKSNMPEFDREWAAAQQQVIARTTALLREIGMSQCGLDYIANMKGYPRIPYFASLWILDAPLRAEVGIAICMHAIGIKLIDDLVDRDQEVSHWDLALGIYLVQFSSAQLAMHHNPRLVGELLARDYRTIWKYQITEAQRPADSLGLWVEYARVKSGLMMANYAAIACAACDRLEAMDAARDYAEAFGVLFMMGDDLRDYHALGERGGNLANLIANQVVPRQAVIDAIEHWLQCSLQAHARVPTAFDVSSFMVGFCQRMQHSLVAQSSGAHE